MKNSWAILITALIAIILLLVGFKDVILYPNQVLLSTGGDGIKNYFTYLYYIIQDNGTHFSGMNYPYGEHILFTDNTPFLSSFITWSKNYFPSWADNSIGILHFVLLINVPIAAIYIFKIMQHFGSKQWWSILSAIFSIFFSPQLFRIYGHFGMAMIAMIPFVIYQLIKYQVQSQIKFVIAIFLVSSSLAFFHLYNLVIVAFLNFSYLLSYWIIEKKSWQQKLRYSLPLLFSTGLSFVLFLSFVSVTDNVNDRPSYPYGTFQYNTVGKDLFVSQTYWGNILKIVFGDHTSIFDGEGNSYIGLIGIAVLIILIIFLFRFLFFKKSNLIIFQDLKPYHIWLLTSLWSLLFAMGFPLIYFKDILTDAIPFLRQFRAMGRFIWIFYYLFMIFSSLFVFHYAQRMSINNKSLTAKMVYIFVIGIWSLQLLGYLQYYHSLSLNFKQNFDNFKDKNSESWTTFLQNHGYKSSDFQALIGLPFYHIGSEKIWIMDVKENYSSYLLFKAALQTKLPIVNVMMSRTSWHQTFEMIKIADGPFSEKSYYNHCNEKPFLILVSDSSLIKPKGKEWIQQSEFLGKKEDGTLVYSITPKQLKIYEDTVRKQAQQLAINTKSEREGVLDNNHSFFYFQHFDHYPSHLKRAGTGAWIPSPNSKKVIIDSFFFPAKREDSMFHFSIWAKCNLYDFRTPIFYIQQFNDKNELISTDEANTKYSTLVDGAWFLTETDFQILKPTQKIQIWVQENNRNRTYLALDEIQIYPVGKTSFYWEENNGKETLWLNNRKQNLQ